MTTPLITRLEKADQGLRANPGDNLMSDAVMVPREPTEAMIAAADCAGMAFAGSDLDSADMTRMIWSAMLAASPQGEGSSVEADQDALIERTCRECRALHRIFTEGVKP